MEFFQAVKQIGIFMICAQAILHFKPSEKYEKYLKLLISVMVLVQILVPIVNFFSGMDTEIFYSRMETIQAEINREMEQLEIESAINEKNVLNEAKKEIKTRVNNIASKYDLSVQYMQVQQADLTEKLIVYVQKEEKMQDISIQNIQIEPISIKSNLAFGETTEQKETREEEKLQLLCKEISMDLNIPEEEIEVLWYE